ncbi:hypothetical protein [Oscillatoria sp. FACHB-1406]|uniref:slr1957 family protein n=1 Tax=Oscillatoria sp. FACHB-1406 TaxID=2692846 RepID=UPI001686944B|nr:hypothetical protein [Oscillatoria sp. FACHB-1406]MBD2576467.1 hypothetical protein [Oscillatoria sp. FACHB-1406]
MRHYRDEWIAEWCGEHGWTDAFAERLNHYWAFPPGAVIPEPIPTKELRMIKETKGLCREERWWMGSAIAITAIAAALCVILKSPMPLVLAFAWSAITVARLEVEAPYQ